VVGMARPVPIANPPSPQALEPDSSAAVSDPLLSARVTLPQNMAATLQRLTASELDVLVRGVAAEIERRRTAKATPEVARPQSVTQARAQSAEVPTGKASLIRASFQAGLRPSQIARSLRVSQAVVNQVLGTLTTSKR
jgi:hypothetical protein